MTWFWFSLFAAVLWGMSYVIYQKLVETLSAAGAMFFTAAGSFLFYIVYMLVSGTFRTDVEVLKKFSLELKLVLLVIVINAMANIFSLLAIKEKNATLMGLVEISYPIFTALFAWIFLKEVQTSVGAWFGAALIVAGVSCIYYFERG